MNILKIKIDRGYASFSLEQENNTHLKQAHPSNVEWFATVTNYVTMKNFTYNFFDWSDGDMELNMVKVGDVIVANHKSKKSHKYSYVYRGIYRIIDIDAFYLYLVIYDTITEAIKAQRKSTIN